MSKGILDAIDMDSYRVEKKAMQKILLPDDDAEITPSSDPGSGGRAEPELDLLSNIIKAFNDLFGNIPWEDGDRVLQLITETIPSRVAQDTAFRNAQKNSDRENARIEHDNALLRVMMAVMKDDTQLFKKFMDESGFQAVDEQSVVPANVQTDGAAVNSDYSWNKLIRASSPTFSCRRIPVVCSAPSCTTMGPALLLTPFAQLDTRRKTRASTNFASSGALLLGPAGSRALPSQGCLPVFRLIFTTRSCSGDRSS